MTRTTESASGVDPERSTTSSQDEIDAEIAAAGRAYDGERARGVRRIQPRYDYPAYHSTRLRSPTKELHAVGPVTCPANTLTSCTDAWGHIANNVLTLSRPEMCSYPLTGMRCVNRVYTQFAVFDMAGGSISVWKTYRMSLAELREKVPVELD